jgi:saccharopine dehydrogenase (NADP+, L-glutamate forming)
MHNVKILVLGAGRSSSALIEALLRDGAIYNWQVTVGDQDEPLARRRIGEAPRGNAIRFDLDAPAAALEAVRQANIVISLLPARLHPAVARLCLEAGRHLLTASYVSAAMQACHAEALAKGLLFLNECGLDPGIDHLSAMAVVHRLQNSGYTLRSFESFTGGLIDPASDPGNPWKYRFTWNPRNVVLAGQGMAKYRAGGRNQYIPYHRLFVQTTPVQVPGVGELDGYANRDSLLYREVYGLQGIDTLLRGTLRFRGFCSAWNVLVQAGCTDDSFLLEEVDRLSHRAFMEMFLPPGADPPETRLAALAGAPVQGDEMKKIAWSGFFSDEPVGLSAGTPAQVTEHILSKRWHLEPHHRDLVVMWHRFVASRGPERTEVQSYFSATGNPRHTAMATTVGLPLAVAARLLATGKLRARGVVIPVQPEVYQPLLDELARSDIRFTETERALPAEAPRKPHPPVG